MTIEPVKCGKPVFCSRWNQTFPCIKEKEKTRHLGKCTPDITGLRIGYMTVVRPAEPYICPKGGKPKLRWVVRHDDGTEKIVHLASLRRGSVSGRYFFHSRYTGTSEYMTVVDHHRNIVRRRNPNAYIGVPFYDDWNPDKGGAFWKGAKWIIDNLGSKPGPQWSLDIVKHEIGFWPDNLRWALRNEQIANRQHRILGQFTDEEFAMEARRRGYIKKE